MLWAASEACKLTLLHYNTQNRKIINWMVASIDFENIHSNSDLMDFNNEDDIS